MMTTYLIIKMQMFKIKTVKATKYALIISNHTRERLNVSSKAKSLHHAFKTKNQFDGKLLLEIVVELAAKPNLFQFYIECDNVN